MYSENSKNLSGILISFGLLFGAILVASLIASAFVAAGALLAYLMYPEFYISGQWWGLYTYGLIFVWSVVFLAADRIFSHRFKGRVLYTVVEALIGVSLLTIGLARIVYPTSSAVVIALIAVGLMVFTEPLLDRAIEQQKKEQGGEDDAQGIERG